MISKLLLILVVVLGVVYWRGTKAITQSKGWDCNWHMAYAICLTENKKVLSADAPKFIDVIKAGTNFKNGFKF